MKLDNLSDILTAIKEKTIEYGPDKEYCFSVDEDGELVLLQRNDAISPYQKDIDAEGEERTQWPANSSDGEVIWKQYTGEGRGLVITEMFLKAIGIEYQG